MQNFMTTRMNVEVFFFVFVFFRLALACLQSHAIKRALGYHVYSLQHCSSCFIMHFMSFCFGGECHLDERINEKEEKMRRNKKRAVLRAVVVFFFNYMYIGVYSSHLHPASY